MRAGDIARRLVLLTRRIADRPLAVAFLRQELLGLPRTDAAEVLAAVHGGVERGDEDAARVALLTSIALAGCEHESARREIASAALEGGWPDIARRLAAATPGRDEREGPPPIVPDFGRGRPLTLGERKSLARGRDRDVLARVLRDPHPDVIRILLDNPVITETDVVRLCARRPIASEVLREVASSTRWMVRYGVRLALARNPHTPLDVALSAVPHLVAQHAREIANSPELDEALRAACVEAGRIHVIH